MKKIGIMLGVFSSFYLSPDAAEGGEEKKEEAMIKNSTLNMQGQTIDIFEQKQTRGKDVGAVFLAPDLENLTFETVAKAWPHEKLMDNFIRPNLKRACNAFTKAARQLAKGDSTVFTAKFQEFFMELSAKSESIRALVIRQNELLQELRKYDPTKGGEELQKFVDVASKIKAVSAQIQELRDAQEEEEVPPAAGENVPAPAQAA